MIDIDFELPPWDLDPYPDGLPPLPPDPWADEWPESPDPSPDMIASFGPEFAIEYAIAHNGQVSPGEIHRWRDRLTNAPVPETEADLIDLVRALEELKSCAAAVQARVAVAFDATRREAEADRGVVAARRGAGVSSEVALARRESPHRGGRLLGLAKALVREMPCTLSLLEQGVLSEWRATLVARETACLSPLDRATVDAWVGVLLTERPAMGDKELVAEVARKVIEIDQEAVVKRRAAAAGGRRVSLQPLPDGMVRFTAILGLQEGVAAYAALLAAANTASAQGGGSGPGRGALMADELVARVTGRTPTAPSDVEVIVVITDQALFGVTDEPAHVDGYGPVDAAWVRDLIADADPDQRIALRRLFRTPGRMVAMESDRRFFTPGLRRLIRLRDQRCRTPWCDAPIRHADHVAGHAQGGATSYVNAQGLCEACNYTKQVSGWSSTSRQDPAHGHTVTITTPTGHTYRSTQPTGPGDTGRVHSRR